MALTESPTGVTVTAPTPSGLLAVRDLGKHVKDYSTKHGHCQNRPACFEVIPCHPAAIDAYVAEKTCGEESLHSHEGGSGRMEAIDSTSPVVQWSLAT